MPVYNTAQRPSKRDDGWPTRADIRYDTDAERLCRVLVGLVDGIGASVPLTRAVILLGQARDAIADHVERIESEPPASDEPARCEGFSWIGQSFAHCDACGKPYWEHTHVRQHRPGAKLFAADAETLVPITPGDAAQVRAQWGTR